MLSPKRIHQRIVGHCYIKMTEYVMAQSSGEVFVSPFDVIFDKGNTCQPDVFYLAIEDSQWLFTKI